MLPELQLSFCSATKGAFHVLKLAGHTGVVKRIPLSIETDTPRFRVRVNYPYA